MRRFLLTIALVTLGCATQDVVTDRLEMSPRHSEWAQIERAGRTIQTWVAYPEVATKAPVVILIHENRGLTDWERGVADRLAENGYIAIAPNMLSGIEVATADAAREAIGKLPPEQVMADLHAVADYAKKIPAADGTLQVAGFCWGGARTWLFANNRSDLAASYVFYGTGPQEGPGVANINAPVYGFYGGNDARVNATIPKTEVLMRAAVKWFEPVTYEGAGHAFMRAGMAADASPENKRAHDEAWARWLKLLRR
jgi:carboxymethylenebutenolidase